MEEDINSSNKEPIKQAFSNVKQDIILLREQLDNLNFELITLKSELRLMSSFIKDIQIYLSKIQIQQKPTPAHNQESPTIQHIIPTQKPTPAHNLPLYSLKRQDIPFSTGNEGVPTDRQTDRQADRQTPEKQELKHIKAENIAEITRKLMRREPFKLIQEQEVKHIEPMQVQIFQTSTNSPQTTKKPQFTLGKSDTELTQEMQKQEQIAQQDQFSRASALLKNLDSIKKEVRLKFKKLTPQEFKVFSTIYQLEEQNQQIDYPLLSKKLNLSGSSIRDYISKIIIKGIPLTKEKLNNKEILLHISPELKKIASLASIIQLREL